MSEEELQAFREKIIGISIDEKLKDISSLADSVCKKHNVSNTWHEKEKTGCEGPSFINLTNELMAFPDSSLFLMITTRSLWSRCLERIHDSNHPVDLQLAWIVNYYLRNIREWISAHENKHEISDFGGWFIFNTALALGEQTARLEAELAAIRKDRNGTTNGRSGVKRSPASVRELTGETAPPAF